MVTKETDWLENQEVVDAIIALHTLFGDLISVELAVANSNGNGKLAKIQPYLDMIEKYGLGESKNDSEKYQFSFDNEAWLAVPDVVYTVEKIDKWFDGRKGIDFVANYDMPDGDLGEMGVDIAIIVKNGAGSVVEGTKSSRFTFSEVAKKYLTTKSKPIKTDIMVNEFNPPASWNIKGVDFDSLYTEFLVLMDGETFPASELTVFLDAKSISAKASASFLQKMFGAGSVSKYIGSGGFNVYQHTDEAIEVVKRSQTE